MKINGKSIIRQNYETYIKPDINKHMESTKKIKKDTVDINSYPIKEMKDKIEAAPDVREDKINSVKTEIDYDILIQMLMEGGFLA